MQHKLKQQRADGFTIIEVMIVLAIAGLIMMIVFMAVPALQRSSRNTQRKNDVSSLMGGIQTYLNNNNGQLPTGSGAAVQTAFANLDWNPGFYLPANVLYTYNTTQTSTMPTADVNKVYIYTDAACTTAGTALATAAQTAASARSVAAIYWVETTGALQPQCQAM